MTINSASPTKMMEETSSTFPMMKIFRKHIPSVSTILEDNCLSRLSQEKTPNRLQLRSQPSKKSSTPSARSKSQRCKSTALPWKPPSKRLLITLQALSLTAQTPRWRTKKRKATKKARSMECQRKFSKSLSKKNLRSKLPKCSQICQRLLAKSLTLKMDK